MLDKTSRPRNTALIGCVLLALFCIALTFSNPVRLWTAKVYFGLENVWVEHWPSQSGRYAIKRLTPLLCDIGLLRPVRMKVDPGVSFLLDPRDLVSVTILRTKEWQPEVWDALSPALAEGAVFLDVGAHIGYFSLKASSKVGETGRVVSFEPNPRTVPLLRDNVAVNHAQNVTVEPIACADRDQMLTLYAAASVNTGASSLSQKNADVSPDQAPKGYAVRGRPIDDVVRELKLERVDAIKIDVEGAEVSVLRGAADTLKRFHPKVVTEMNPSQLASFNTTPEDVAALLRSAGYNHSKAVDDTDWEWTYLGANNSASVVRVADDATASQLLRGFHGVEYNAWRWTAADFTIAFRTPERADRNGAWLSLKLTVPEASLKKLGSITLSAKIGGAAVGSETFTTPGNHEFRTEAPASAFKKETTEVDFSLDKSLPPNATDPRQLGVIVTSAALVAK